MKENSIEEYVKILEEKMNKELDFFIENASKSEQLTAISMIAMKEPIILLFLSILSDYKRVLKENEELRKKLNEENKRCMMIAIEKQDYFEKYRYHLQQNESLTKEFSNVIPVQKVKDKIKEIGEKIKYEENEKVVIYLHKQKNILQELLKESEEEHDGK